MRTDRLNKILDRVDDEKLVEAIDEWFESCRPKTERPVSTHFGIAIQIIGTLRHAFSDEIESITTKDVPLLGLDTIKKRALRKRGKGGTWLIG